ncbi:MAG: type IX secretion system PorP/SprF family membrane protein [Bacteroidia bacterium]|jgi:type IX secretion system PorP/SprF family membrane protein
MKNLKMKLYSLLALVIVSANVYAQQVPLYSQYYFNKFVYNPAMTGHSGTTTANLFGRNQYTALDGFQTTGATISGQVNDGKVGLGLYVISDASLLQTQNSVYGNYAYNIALSDANKLSLGFALGVLSNRFNTENIISTDPNDPALRLLSTRPGAVLDASIGANLKLGDFQVGLSVPQFLGSSQEFTDLQNSSLMFDLQNHLMFITSYDIWVNDDLKIQPMVLLKNTKNAPGQFDINLIADWVNKGWLGAAYRDGYGVTAMAGLRIAERLKFGYSYDWSVGDYSQALGGSHEILVGIDLNQSKNKKASQEEMDRVKAEMAAKHDADLKAQDKKLKDIEDKLANVETQKRQVDTVYVVQKVATPAKTTVTPTQTGDKSGKGREQAGSGNFIVVAGSFGEETNATKYFNTLVNKGFSPYMYYNKSGTYYVHLGRYYFKEEARTFAKSNARNGVKLWVKTL